MSLTAMHLSATRRDSGPNNQQAGSQRQRARPHSLHSSAAHGSGAQGVRVPYRCPQLSSKLLAVIQASALRSWAASAARKQLWACRTTPRLNPRSLIRQLWTHSKHTRRHQRARISVERMAIQAAQTATSAAGCAALCQEGRARSGLRCGASICGGTEHRTPTRRSSD